MRNVIVVLTLLTLAVMSGCVSQTEQEKEIKIGASIPLTGPLSAWGLTGKDSIELANSMRPDIRGDKITVLFEDDKGDPTEAVKIASKFLEVDKSRILIGSASSTMMATVPLTEQKKAILMSWISATPRLTTAGDYVFRTSSSSKLMAETAAKSLLSANMTRVAILYEINEYPAGWKDVFSKEFTEAGGTITGVESFNSAESDVRSQLVKLESVKPDAIFMMIITPGAAKSSIRQFSELGLKQQAMGNEVFSLNVVRKNNSDVEGMTVLRYKFYPSARKSKEFLEAYEKKFGKQPSEELYGAMAFDAYNLLADSMGKCENDLECIKMYLYSVKYYEGASGTFSIDENGDSVHEFVMSRIANGTLEDI